jgi:hypothetical protein
MEAVIELYKCAWNTVDTYTCQPPNYTPLLSDCSVHSPTSLQLSSSFIFFFYFDNSLDL